jgi:Zn-dependent protease with chaperone function
MDLWTARQGGCLEGSWQTRAAFAAQPLIARCTGVHVCIAVLETEKVGAFGWPNGHIFVTRGLVDRLNNAELAAAIAHELGHLLDSGRLRMIGKDSESSKTVDSSDSDRHDPDREVRADAAGLQLLRADNIPPQSMLSMLRKVETCGALTPSGRLAVDRRLQLLSTSLGASALTDVVDGRPRVAAHEGECMTHGNREIFNTGSKPPFAP